MDSDLPDRRRPIMVVVGAAIRGTLSFPTSPWYNVLPTAAVALLIGPIEEFGWRGLSLPLLQRQFAPLWAGMLLGTIWAIWHIPASMLPGTPQSAWSLAPFLLGVVAIAVMMRG